MGGFIVEYTHSDGQKIVYQACEVGTAYEKLDKVSHRAGQARVKVAVKTRDSSVDRHLSAAHVTLTAEGWTKTLDTRGASATPAPFAAVNVIVLGDDHGLHSVTVKVDTHTAALIDAHVPDSITTTSVTDRTDVVYVVLIAGQVNEIRSRFSRITGIEEPYAGPVYDILTDVVHGFL